MSKFTFNFKITPALVVEYELSIPPFYAALRGNKLALTSTASDAEEPTLRERADEVAHNLARGLSYEHSQRFDVAYQGRHVLRPTGQQSVSISVQLTIKPAASAESLYRDEAGRVADIAAQIERERLATQQRLGERATRAANPNLRDMLDHWARYVGDPDGRLHPLYDVLEVAERVYKGRKLAALALNVSKADLDELGRIANDPTLLHGRHLGESQGPHRIATESEINTCVRVARAVIDGYEAHVAALASVPSLP